MSLPRIAKRDDWLAARKALLAEEKDLTRRRDALNRQRRELPMVEVDDLTALGRQEEWEEPKGRTESARAGKPDFAS